MRKVNKCRSTGKNTPPLDGPEDMEVYVGSHLSYHLHWLLAAATEWSIQNQLNLGKGGYQVQVYTMDSAFLHARVLFEFFTVGVTKNHYGCDQFAGDILKSDLYEQWKRPLHGFLMHAQDRSNPKRLKCSDGTYRHLNEMPIEFAQEVLRLWKVFESMLRTSGASQTGNLEQLAVKMRKKAIKAAGYVVKSEVAMQHANEKGQTLEPIFKFVP